MKQKYLLEKSEMVKIPTPEKLNDLIGKYFLHKVDKMQCFYKTTNIDICKCIMVFKHIETISLFTMLEGEQHYEKFNIDNLPPFYEKKMTKNKVLFNIWE